jgi:DNA-binding beta-propeller fold protein YncE
VAGTSYPIQTVSSSNGSYLFVANHSTANTNYQNSSISSFLLEPGNGQLQQVSSTLGNPFPVGSGPVCIAIDPTNQYIYTSDQYSSTVTGKRIDNNFGSVSNLTRGSTFPTVGTPSCLVISGNVGD